MEYLVMKKKNKNTYNRTICNQNGGTRKMIGVVFKRWLWNVLWNPTDLRDGRMRFYDNSGLSSRIYGEIRGIWVIWSWDSLINLDYRLDFTRIYVRIFDNYGFYGEKKRLKVDVCDSTEKPKGWERGSWYFRDSCLLHAIMNKSSLTSHVLEKKMNMANNNAYKNRLRYRMVGVLVTL